MLAMMKQKVMAVQASDFCFSFYNALGISSKKKKESISLQ